MPKYVKKTAAELQQGDKVRTWGGDITVHKNDAYPHTTAEGRTYRQKILFAGGETWDVAEGYTYQVLYVKEPKKPTFWFSEVLMLNVMTFLVTSLIWCLYTYKHFDVIIPIFDGR